MKKVIGPFFEQVYKLDQYSQPHKYPLAGGPFTIDVELTNHCNFNCAFCDRQIMKRPKGYLEMDVFKKVADQASEAGCLGVRFIRWGEPYLHPGVLEAVKYAKRKGLLVHITTNGMLLNHDQAALTIESGLDNIIFSMQGVDEKSYLEMRQVPRYGDGQYQLLKKNIESLMAMREKLGADNPFTQVTTTTLDETKEQIQAWKDFWNVRVDLATYTGPTSFYRVKDQARVQKFLPRHKYWKRDSLCNEVLTKLAVNWNGDFTACANDYDNYLLIGNVNNTTIKQVWRSPKMNEIRDVLFRNQADEIKEKIPYCSFCRNKF